MKRLLITGALIALGLTIWLTSQNQSTPPADLPWQIDANVDGTSRVFGLTLGHSTLQDARDRFGPDMEVAVVAAPGEAGLLEAYYGQVSIGAITGKMVFVGDVDTDTVSRLRERAPTSEFMESTTRKFIVSSADLPLAYAARIATVTFIPSANFDQATALARFGEPQERIRVNDELEHLLYPDKGLDIAINAKGKEVLQYVAPREFERLRKPLHQAGAARR